MKEIIIALIKIVMRIGLVYVVCLIFTTTYNPLLWGLAWKIAFVVFSLILLSAD